MAWEHVPITLQSQATVTGNGTPFGCIGYKTLLVEVLFSGTATGTVVFEGASTSGNFYPLVATNLSTLTTSTQSTASGIWQIDISALTTVRARISTITPGTGGITAQGEVLAN